MMGRLDAETSAAAIDGTLMLETLRLGRDLSLGLAHDVNSALQCLGDSLFAIREDVGPLLDDSASARGDARHGVPISLRMAADVSDRLLEVGVALAELLPRISSIPERIDLRRELPSLVALTAPKWRKRVAVELDIPVGNTEVTCVWWVLRLGALRLLLALIDASGELGGDTGIVVRLAVAIGVADVEIVGSLIASGASAVCAARDPDPVLAACMARLGAVMECIAGLNSWEIRCIIPDSSLSIIHESASAA
jgi:hypothetical protein